MLIGYEVASRVGSSLGHGHRVKAGYFCADRLGQRARPPAFVATLFGADLSG